jgi:SAM-dependent methyltransferase
VVSSWLAHHLACPRDQESVSIAGDTVVCPNGHRYPSLRGVPIMLVEESVPTHPVFNRTLDLAHRGSSYEPEVVGPIEQNRPWIDPFVRNAVSATCGYLYKGVGHRLTRYPIPKLRLPPTDGATFLDVGCNWGRWTIAAARSGYRAIGLDPSLDAVLAGSRVSRQLGLEIEWLVGDARHLPFAESTFDVSFSYSVLQHFDKQDARTALAQVARATRHGGTVLIQMPNKFGARQVFNTIRQRVHDDRGIFRVRYWSPAELRKTFTSLIGPSALLVDGFFSLNAQIEDRDLLPRRYRPIVSASEQIRSMSRWVPALVNVADSVYVHAVNEKAFLRPSGNRRSL